MKKFIIVLSVYYSTFQLFSQTIEPCTNPEYNPQCISTLTPISSSSSAFYEDNYVYSGGSGQIIKYDVSDIYNVKESILVRDERMGSVFSMVTYGDYIYAAGRTGTGSKEDITAKVRLKFDDSITDFSKSLGEFDSVSTFSNIIVKEDGSYSPMTYYTGKSLRFSAIDNYGSALLYKKIDEVLSQGELSLWLNNKLSMSDEVYIPVLSYRGVVTTKIVLKQTDLGLSLGLYDVHSSSFAYSPISIPSEDWFQIKLQFSVTGYSLYYRSKECGEWDNIVSLSCLNNNLSIDELVIGVENLAKNDEVLVDDFYMDQNNLDDVSYINGALTIANKITGEIYNIYHYEMKGTGVDVCGNLLAVSGFYGVNLYDITNPSTPTLIYWEKAKKGTEHHRCKFFTADDGHQYLLVNLYSAKYRLYEVKDSSTISFINEYKFNSSSSDGTKFDYNWLGYGLTIDYPYAYFPMASSKSNLGTEEDHRGVIAVDLTHVTEPVFSFAEIPMDSLTFPKSGDPRPTKIAKYKNKLFVNNSNKGIIMLDITNPMNPVYQCNIPLATQRVCNDVCASPDGKIFSLDEQGNGGLNIVYSAENPEAELMKFDFSICNSEWFTFCVPFDFIVFDGMELYSIDAIVGNSLAVSLQDNGVAHSPYLVHASPGDYLLSGLIKTNFSSSLSNGLLVGTYEDVIAPIDSYVLQSTESGIGFYRVENSINVPAFSAYLRVPNSNVNLEDIYLIKDISLDTELLTISSPSVNIAAVYSLTGAKTKANLPGCYIIEFSNGKKNKIMIK